MPRLAPARAGTPHETAGRRLVGQRVMLLFQNSSQSEVFWAT